jgi:hypothetical protein
VARKAKPENIDVLVGQLNLMAQRLLVEGAKIPAEELVVEYDNGGGQTGTRENPFYPAYEKLLSSFVKTLAAVQASGEARPAEVSKLEDLRKKIKVIS